MISAARRQMTFKFHKVVLCGSRKTAKLGKPTKVESKMADDTQIFNIRTLISMEPLKLECSNLVYASTTRSNIWRHAKTRSKETWPGLGDLDFKFTDSDYQGYAVKKFLGAGDVCMVWSRDIDALQTLKVMRSKVKVMTQKRDLLRAK